MNPTRSRLAILLALAPLFLFSCAGTSDVTSPRQHTRNESPAQRLFRAAGNQSVVTILLDPRRFSELQDLDPLLSLLSRREREQLRRAVRAPSLWAAVGELVQSPTPWPSDLKGWDPTRPVALALFAPSPMDVGSLALALLQPKGQPKGPLYMRHRMLIPATDAAVLAQSLQDLFGSLEGAPAATHAKGVYGNPGLLLTINAAGDHVRIEMLLESRNTDETPPWDLLPALTAPPLAPPPQSAAQHLVTQGEERVDVYVRPDRLRAANLVFGGGKVLSALAGIDPEMHTALAVKGWAELAGGDLILGGGGGGMISDNALALSAGAEGPRLTAVLDLTAAGAAAWTAATQTARQPKLTWSGPVVARFGLTMDLATLVRQAPPAPGLPDGNLNELVDRVKECGSACLLYLGLRSPLRALHVAAMAQAGILDSLPRGGDVVVTATQRGSAQGSLAVVLPETPLLDKLLGQLDREFASDSKTRVSHSAVAVGEGLVLHRFGLEQEPTAAYGAEVGKGRGDLLNLEADFAPLLTTLGTEESDLGRLLGSYRGLRSRVALSGSTLVARTVLLRGAAGASPQLQLPQLHGKTAPAVRTPGQVCLQQVQEGMVKAFNDISSIDPALRLARLKEAEAQTAAAQRCAQQDPQTRGSVERMQQALARAQQVCAATP